MCTVYVSDISLLPDFPQKWHILYARPSPGFRQLPFYWSCNSTTGRTSRGLSPAIPHSPAWTRCRSNTGVFLLLSSECWAEHARGPTVQPVQDVRDLTGSLLEICRRISACQHRKCPLLKTVSLLGSAPLNKQRRLCPPPASAPAVPSGARLFSIFSRACSLRASVVVGHWGAGSLLARGAVAIRTPLPARVGASGGGGLTRADPTARRMIRNGVQRAARVVVQGAKQQQRRSMGGGHDDHVPGVSVKPASSQQGHIGSCCCCPARADARGI